MHTRTQIKRITRSLSSPPRDVPHARTTSAPRRPLLHTFFWYRNGRAYSVDVLGRLRDPKVSGRPGGRSDGRKVGACVCAYICRTSTLISERAHPIRMHETFRPPSPRQSGGRRRGFVRLATRRLGGNFNFAVPSVAVRDKRARARTHARPGESDVRVECTNDVRCVR